MRRYKAFDDANIIEIIAGSLIIALPFILIIARL